MTTFTKIEIFKTDTVVRHHIIKYMIFSSPEHEVLSELL